MDSPLRTSAQPRMAETGFRSSWHTIARNSAEVHSGLDALPSLGKSAVISSDNSTLLLSLGSRTSEVINRVACEITTHAKISEEHPQITPITCNKKRKKAGVV